MAFITNRKCGSCPEGKQRSLELIAYEMKNQRKGYVSVCFRCDSLHEWPRLGRK